MLFTKKIRHTLMVKIGKKNKEYVVSARYTEDEYLDILLKISDANGKKMMSVGAFSKVATLSGKVTIIEKELEQYRTFIASRISNNINQIAKRLNTDHKADLISEKTYIDVLNQMEILNHELNKLLEPLR